MELPGRRARLRETPIRQAEALVQATAGALSALQDLPFAFFGHSMGALLAFELALHLRRAGQPGPRALFLSAAAAPQLPRRHRPMWNLPDAEFLKELRHYGGTPEEVFADPAMVSLFLPALRADFELFDTYAYGGATLEDVPLYVYGGRDDVRVTPGSLRAWGEVAPGLQAVELFPGGHFYLHEQRAALIAGLRRELQAHVPGHLEVAG
ncbi:Thioesterase [Myxococcus hansupus]|uniref:Thioesterase n=1 Tax=Pseudomyxococcus hansupus TaxID=1297742 RepID=A0A0H4XCT2_9BACT|nr:Thioesterase [Myxococcus hansupus]